MSYRRYSPRAEANRKQREMMRQPHVIWRGIGCMMIIILPLISFAASDIIVQYGKTNWGVSIPPQWRAELAVPFYGVVQDFIAVLVLTIVLAFGMFTLMFVFYAALYKMSGDRTYSALDAPPQRYKPRKRR